MIIALYDACVLYPAPLRDFLMHLALTGLVAAKWTDRIHDEWTGALLAKRPDLTRAQLERTRELMNSHVLDCLVTEYEGLIKPLNLPDLEDRHVLAAAIRSGASVIVTYNLKHFPPERLAQFGIEAQHPDLFIARLIDIDPDQVCAAAKRQRASLKNPPRTAREFLATLADQRLPKTVAQLQARSALL